MQAGTTVNWSSVHEFMPAPDAEIKAAIRLFLGNWAKVGTKGKKIELLLLCGSLTAS